MKRYVSFRMSPAMCNLILLAVFMLCLIVSGHSANEHTNDINKERVEDGAFKKSEKDHLKDGEHRSEFDHESILGSKNRVDEFDHLSPEESKNRLAELIPQMDGNKDGLVDKEELTNWILKSFKMLSNEEGQERLEEVDANHDGRATWDEYATETYGLFDNREGKGEENDQFVEEQKAMLQEDKELFKAADQDNDGFLYGEEFLAFTHPEEYAHMLPVLYDRALKDKDTDKDGFISLNEFLTTGDDGKQHNKEWFAVEKDRFENEYDKNKDGKLSRDELRPWIAPDEREAAAQEASYLIKNADDTKDNVLSFDEILGHHDLFVGSEATDYGGHLNYPDKLKDEL